MNRLEKILMVVCFITMFGLGIASVKVWENQRVQAAIRAEQNRILQEGEQRTRSLAIENEKAKLKRECEKSRAYYNALPAKERTQREAPNCDLELLQ